MIEPNNLRNRYRRYRAAWKAYGWVGAWDFRTWVRESCPGSYSVPE